MNSWKTIFLLGVALCGCVPSTSEVTRQVKSSNMEKNTDAEISFENLASVWDKFCDENRFSSNIETYLEHESFGKLIKEGPAIVPWIMNRYENDGSARWGFLLEEITGEGLSTNREDFNPHEMRTKWLNWYKEKGIEKTHENR